ncbi:MAG: penicillin-binding protein activator LpoB [Candidatus Polarisedimenticolaceae bacterium]|nr:penicillin-binding protein activator LpoB [Candidatus Polarisedimenticolaceae bacterium]
MKIKVNFNKGLPLIFMLLLIVVLSGCGGTKVVRVDASEEHAINDRWNSKDSQLVADEMIADMLSFPWLKRFNRENPGKRAVIIIGRVKNKSHEHIAVDMFINDIKKAVIRSDLADFVVGSAERQDLRSEKADQDLHAKDAVEAGQEEASSFMLSGTINSIAHKSGNKSVTSYQIDLKLANVKTNREAWVGQKKIQKVAEKSSFGW